MNKIKKLSVFAAVLCVAMLICACDFTSGVDITLAPIEDGDIHPDSLTDTAGSGTLAPDGTQTGTGDEESTAGTTVTAENTTAQPPYTGTVSGEYGLVKECAPVDKSYFDDAVFLGDSISLMLKTYALTGALGGATVFAQGSYSLTNALYQKLDASDSTHPSYQGVRMYAEDAVAAVGAKKVYIMLGMNDLVYGVDTAISNYKLYVSKIKAKSPEVQIFIQSMTPMRNSSNVLSGKLNNDKIKEYNQKLETLCKNEGWYYIAVESIMWESDGSQLRADYCSDGTTMGLHMTTAACKAWVEYLYTHAVKFD